MTEQTTSPSSPSDGVAEGDGGDERVVPPASDGEGPVGLEDRTGPGSSGGGYTGSPVGNQAKAEPMPPTPGHRDPNAPLEPPLLASMNVGAADPQAPSHGAAAGSGPAPTATATATATATPTPAPAPAPTDLGGPGAAPSADRPVPSVGSSTGRATGPEHPAETSVGTSSRSPGVMGSTGPDESVETDVEASAAQMRPTGAPSLPGADRAGDAGGVPVTAHEPPAGTSEEQAAVRGARTPQPPPG